MFCNSLYMQCLSTVLVLFGLWVFWQHLFKVFSALKAVLMFSWFRTRRICSDTPFTYDILYWCIPLWVFPERHRLHARSAWITCWLDENLRVVIGLQVSDNRSYFILSLSVQGMLLAQSIRILRTTRLLCAGLCEWKFKYLLICLAFWYTFTLNSVLIYDTVGVKKATLSLPMVVIDIPTVNWILAFIAFMYYLIFNFTALHGPTKRSEWSPEV